MTSVVPGDPSRARLAAASGMSAKHISDIERAIVAPRATTVLRLTAALDLSPHELFARYELRLKELRAAS